MVELPSRRACPQGSGRAHLRCFSLPQREPQPSKETQAVWGQPAADPWAQGHSLAPSSSHQPAGCEALCHTSITPPPPATHIRQDNCPSHSLAGTGLSAPRWGGGSFYLALTQVLISLAVALSETTGRRPGRVNQQGFLIGVVPAA